MNNRDSYITSKDLQIQEKILLSVFKKKDPIVIFDIGACEGESSIRYARLYPNAEIYTFEPLPSNFELVKKNIAHYKTDNVHPVQLCLSEKEGIQEFYVSSGKPEHAGEENWDYGNKSSSLLPPAKTTEVHPWLKFEQAITVQTSTLDAFCKAQRLGHIDFIHIDVQGAELMVLTGAQDFMQQINCIWLEVEAVELYKDQPLKMDIEDFLSAHGFVKLEDTVYTHAGDQFWTRKEFILQSKGKWFVVKSKLISGLKSRYKKIRRRIFN